MDNNSTSHGPVILLLDEDISSEKLKSKIKDISLSEKTFLTYEFTQGFENIYDPCCLQFDIVRDGKFVIREVIEMYDNHMIEPTTGFRCLWRNRAILLEFLKVDGSILKYAPDTFRNDKEIVMQAVKQYGMMLEFASDALRADRQIVLEAVKNWGTSIKFASQELREDRKVVLEAVRNDGYALELLPNFSNDREVVLVALSNRGWALQYASVNLCGDREIVLAALKTNASALRFASEELQQDPDIRQFAIDQNDPLFVC